MRKAVYVLFVASFLVLFIAQCRHKEEAKISAEQKFETDSFIATSRSVKEADSMAKAATTAAADEKNVTSIKFDKEVYDFGECTEGDKITKTIEFTNTGKLPLVIKNAYGSCGCTIPTYDKEPVLPRKKGKLQVEFNSQGKPGANTKSIMVEANTSPPVNTISFSVKVNTKEKKGLFK